MGTAPPEFALLSPGVRAQSRRGAGGAALGRPGGCRSPAPPPPSPLPPRRSAPSPGPNCNDSPVPGDSRTQQHRDQCNGARRDQTVFVPMAPFPLLRAVHAEPVQGEGSRDQRGDVRGGRSLIPRPGVGQRPGARSRTPSYGAFGPQCRSRLVSTDVSATISPHAAAVSAPRGRAGRRTRAAARTTKVHPRRRLRSKIRSAVTAFAGEAGFSSTTTHETGQNRSRIRGTSQAVPPPGR